MFYKPDSSPPINYTRPCDTRLPACLWPQVLLTERESLTFWKKTEWNHLTVPARFFAFSKPKWRMQVPMTSKGVWLSCRNKYWNLVFLPTKVHIVKATVFPVVMYGCESWIIKKADCQRIYAFELWCWRRLENPLDSKQMKPVSPKGNQPWVFTERTDAQALML